MKYIVITLLCLFGISIVLNVTWRNNLTQQKHDFKSTYDSIQTQLRLSNTERDSLRVVAVDLNRSYKALDSLDKAEEKELTKIPGSFNHLKGNQLREEMIREYERQK